MYKIVKRTSESISITFIHDNSIGICQLEASKSEKGSKSGGLGEKGWWDKAPTVHETSTLT